MWCYIKNILTRRKLKKSLSGLVGYPGKLNSKKSNYQQSRQFKFYWIHVLVVRTYSGMTGVGLHPAELDLGQIVIEGFPKAFARNIVLNQFSSLLWVGEREISNTFPRLVSRLLYGFTIENQMFTIGHIWVPFFFLSFPVRDK